MWKHNINFHGFILMKLCRQPDIKSMFGSVVVVVFQIAFRVEIHVNDVFLFFKNYFWHQHIKMILKVQTILNFSKKKKLKFNQTQIQPQIQTGSKVKRKMCVLIFRFLLALIMTKCVPHIFPCFFSESSSCQEDRKDHMSLIWSSGFC